MDLQAEKIELIRLLIETESPEVINRVKSAFINEDYDFYDDLFIHEKESIQKGLKDIEDGNFREHKLVMHDVKVKYGIKG